MYHPTTRLLALLEILQARSFVSAEELTQRLEIDRRSLRRYILMLQEMGIPIEGRRGPIGGYRLRPGYKLPPLMFTEEEALAVTLGLLGIQWLPVALSTLSVERALAKIYRVLPTLLRERAQTLSRQLVMEPHLSEEVPDLSLMITLSEAIQETKSLLVKYSSQTQEMTERQIDPYGLAGWAGHWYLVGYCHLRHGLRTFRLDRMRAVRILSASFSRPRSIDYLAFIIESIATMPGKWAIEVEFHCSIEEVQKKLPAAHGQIEATETGVRYRCHFDHLPEVARYLVGLGLPFVVRHPHELREALQEFAMSIMQIAAVTPAN